MGLLLDWEWRYFQTDSMNIEAKNVSTFFFCLGFLVRYDSLYWPTQAKIFSSSFDSIKMLTTPLHVKTLSI